MNLVELELLKLLERVSCGIVSHEHLANLIKVVIQMTQLDSRISADVTALTAANAATQTALKGIEQAFVDLKNQIAVGGTPSQSTLDALTALETQISQATTLSAQAQTDATANALAPAQTPPAAQ